MSSVQSLRQFVCDRLTAAAHEILGAFEKRLENYEAEIIRQRRLLLCLYTRDKGATNRGEITYQYYNYIFIFIIVF